MITISTGTILKYVATNIVSAIAIATARPYRCSDVKTRVIVVVVLNLLVHPRARQKKCESREQRKVVSRCETHGFGASSATVSVGPLGWLTEVANYFSSYFSVFISSTIRYTLSYAHTKTKKTISGTRL